MSPDAGHSLLFVRHGPGRGRHPEYTRPITDYLDHEVPGLEGRIRIHETGGGGRARLDGVAAVVFWLADPLRELYPDCYAEAVEIARAARGRGLHVVNPPESLSNSIKSVQSRLWQEAGVPTPSCRTFRDHDELVRILEGIEPPYIVRPDHLHTQAGMSLVQSVREARELRAAVARVLCPGIMVPFVDTRESYRETAATARSMWARWYHKKRAMVFGDIVKPNHVFFAAEPVVSLSRSVYGRYAQRSHRWGLLAWLRPRDRAALAVDNAFWQGRPEQPELMRRAVRALGLDVAAIDYSTFADGRVILWEANPYFYLSDWRLGALPRQRRLRARIEGFYAALGAYFLGLLRADDLDAVADPARKGTGTYGT